MILAWSTLLQVSNPNSKVSRQNSKLVYEIFQFLKQAVSANWHADSGLVIIMELKRKSTVVHVLFEPVSVSRGTEIYLSHGMEWDIMSFQLQRVWIYYLICIYLIRSWCIIDSTFLFLTSNTFLVNSFTIKFPHEINLERWIVCRHSTAAFYSFKLPCRKIKNFQPFIEVL